MKQESNDFNQNNSNKQNENNFNSTNDTESINNTNLDNTKHTDRDILKKICKILSITVAIIGGIRGSYVIILALKDGPGVSGTILNFFAFLAVASTFAYHGVIIGIIWIIYKIIKSISKFYEKLSRNAKKIFKILLIITFSLLLIIFCSIKKYNYTNKDIKETLDKKPSDDYENSTYYFIYKDKIYYYELKFNGMSVKDCMYVMNLDGTNNKKIAESIELRYASFYFVYNDEAYYFSPYYATNKKINLNTGKITDLGTSDIYIDKTLNNDTVYSFIDNAVVDNTYSIFKKIDIKNNKTISEIKTEYSMTGKEFIFDYDGGNIYYLEESYSKYPSIYKNNEIIYEFAEYNKQDFPKIKFIAVNNTYIYFKQNDIIYKFNVNNKSIEKEIDNELSDIKIIYSGNNTDNYYYSNGAIYEFDTNNDIFIQIINNVENRPQYIYNINDKLIFTENTDNIRYFSEENNYGTVLVYNKLDNNIEKFNNIRKVSFDDKYMYMLYESNNKYSVNKYKLN